MLELDTVLVDVWRQASGDGAKFVQIGSEKISGSRKVETGAKTG